MERHYRSQPGHKYSRIDRKGHRIGRTFPLEILVNVQVFIRIEKRRKVMVQMGLDLQIKEKKS
jgi:hypothetical protein